MVIVKMVNRPIMRMLNVIESINDTKIRKKSKNSNRNNSSYNPSYK